MDKGDIYVLNESIAAGAFLDCQPAAGHEIAINNIYHEDSIELEHYDGTNFISFDEFSGKGAVIYCDFRCTNSMRIRIKNVAESAKRIAVDGVYTKVS